MQPQPRLGRWRDDLDGMLAANVARATVYVRGNKSRAAAPQVAGRDESFRSEIREHVRGQTEALEELAVEMLARWLSVRHIEDGLLRGRF